MNKFQVKREMYEILSEFDNRISDGIKNCKEEVERLESKPDEERYCWDNECIEQLNAKIKAFESIRTHMEKLL